MSAEARAKALKELERLEKMPPHVAGIGGRPHLYRMAARLPWSKRDQGQPRHDHAWWCSTRTITASTRSRNASSNSWRAQASKSCKAPDPLLRRAAGRGQDFAGTSIARALGRKFVRMSLGGVRDEAEIRGHRRTYVGALPGRIIQALEEGRHINPLFMLDEIDKMSAWISAATRRRPCWRCSIRSRTTHSSIITWTWTTTSPRVVHHHGQPAGHDAAAAAGPDGGHRVPRLHGEGEAQYRAAIPGPEAARGERAGGTKIDLRRQRCCDDPGITRARPACAVWSARSPRCAARSPARWCGKGKTTSGCVTGRYRTVPGAHQVQYGSQGAVQERGRLANGLAWTEVGGEILKSRPR